MSEDSIASDFISCRIVEANAPLLPPRKRLLAGFKQNGCTSSVSSCVTATVEPPQDTENLCLTFINRLDDLDHDYVEVNQGSLQSFNSATESVVSYSRRQRKSKCHGPSSGLTVKKSKKMRNIVSETDNGSSHVDERASRENFASHVKLKSDADADVPSSKISSVVVQESLPINKKDLQIQSREEVGGDANGEASNDYVGKNLRPRSKIIRVLEVDKEAAYVGDQKRRRASFSRTKKGKIAAVTKNHHTMYIRNPTAGNHTNKKVVEQTKQAFKHTKNSEACVPLADEELARQLHRAMNSSPRIARSLCL
ncbi:hypothetical protein KP509_16G056600 [Ceratopteris richardii]|uniref:Uncharacterized protein n=1 Tax=Ceratopteris richardii TaxID=49495 RepID=A0A8T2T2B1_CERRI|nr:hypothetical protein KP509_16G056600 [Ceratopteris richardii]KAH7388083.1 hypothetical protein KP509_16G056600 [Ceratopteris richardii]KAH7388085.1 hypothetical protein KP509_16G056600 [Ceratopteris richardii]